MGSSIVEAVQSRQSIPNLSGLPAGLVPIVSHMLEPNPARRPASMDELRSMLENPALIPLQYREGLPPPPAIELTGRGPMPTVPPLTNPPPGLQVPTARFGHTTTRTTIPPLDPVKPERSWGGSLAALVLLAGLGGGGWYAWQSGLLDPFIATAGEIEGVAAEVVEGIPEPDTNTRDGFLAAVDTGPCTLTTRVAAGANAGMIEGYSSTGERFGGLPVAYEEKFGARPAILPREVTVDQCAALDFARALQGREHPPVTFQMFSEEVRSGEEIQGQIRTAGEQAIWPVLVAPNGGIYNLSDQVSAPVNWQRSMRFAMNLEAGSSPVPQVVLVVSSDKPLTLAATAEPGALAAELLPLVLDEIARSGGAASASLAYVLLTP
jgi:serine/threonine-protein kinase